MEIIIRLIEHGFNIICMVFLVRLLLQLAQADFYNPIAQFVHKFTAPFINPLRNILPDMGRFSLAALVVVLILIIIKFYIFGLILGQQFPSKAFTLGSLVGLFFTNGFSISGLVAIFTNLLLVLFIGLMVTSFMSGGQYHPAMGFFQQVTSPILRPVQKIIPPIGGTIDLSPMLVLLVLFFIQSGLIGLVSRLLN